MPDDTTARLVSALVPETPALVYVESKLIETAKRIQYLTNQAGCDLIYAMKPCTLTWVLNTISPFVTGFAASSPFEAQLARGILKDEGALHYHSVVITPEEFDQISVISNFISFNSIKQLQTHTPGSASNISVGLRVNPGISFVTDERYDPCRRHSKLGVPVDTLSRIPSLTSDGLMFHSNCESTNLGDLLNTVGILEHRLTPMLESLEWINLGGGYMLRSCTDADPLKYAVSKLKRHGNLKVFIEPGGAFVRDAGYIVSTILDIFDSNGVNVVILDTTINHMPEVFEYQFEPTVMDYDSTGTHRYILAGRSCLAGDIFGDYTFKRPLKIGDRVTFLEMGAYTQPKAHTFNGINLPNTYALGETGSLSLIASTGYDEFATRNGADRFAHI